MRSDTIIVALALTVIIALLALPLFLPTKWEYRIEAVPDMEFAEEMNAYGEQGWEVVFARRASNRITDDFSYEIIFKRATR